MTGIERLRGFAQRMDELSVWPGGAKLLSIADQIERERAEDCYRMGLDYGAVSRVVSDMERHVLGHEGMEDSPVARWARELREALACHEDEEVEDVATVRAEAMEAWRWAREHGGLDSVKEEWHSRVPYDRHEKTRQRLLDHIAECETALGRRNRRIEELGHRVNDLTTENAELRRRAMPEGCEWPCFEDGEPVRFGDVVSDGDEMGRVYYVTFDTVNSVIIGFTDEEPDRDPGTWLEVSVSDGERVKRLAPKVLDADGVEIRVGDTVWTTNGLGPFEVTRIVNADRLRVICDDEENGHLNVYPQGLTHQRPVLDADGNRIEPAMDVWWVCEGDERGIHAEKLHVESIGEDGLVTCDPFNGGTWVELEPFELYVHKPVLDANGVPIHEGDTVWCMATNDELTDMNIVRKNWPTMRAKLTVKSIISDSHGDKWADFEETYLYVKTCYLTHTNPGPRRTCQDCRFWQKDPTARTMGVCWRNYAERDCEDSYEARTEDAPACEYFRERGE